MKRRSVLLVPVLGGTLLFSSPMQAQEASATADEAELGSPQAGDNAAYKRAITHALEEYGVGHFAEARSLLEQAHGLYPNARTLRGLGMVEFELRHYAAAKRRLEAALASHELPLTPDQRRAVEELLVRTRSFLAEYTLEVEPKRDDIRVELDGKPQALAPERRLTIVVGEHVLRIAAPGAATHEVRLDVKGGEQRTLHVDLTLESSAKEQPAPGRPARPHTSLVRPYAASGIALMSAGGATLLAAGALGGVALAKAGAADASRGPAADAARRLGTVTDVALGVGIASVVVGIVLWTRRQHRPPEDEHSRLRAAGSALSVRF